MVRRPENAHPFCRAADCYHRVCTLRASGQMHANQTPTPLPRIQSHGLDGTFYIYQEGSGTPVAAVCAWQRFETELEGSTGGEHERLPCPDRPKPLVLTFSMRAMLP